REPARPNDLGARDAAFVARISPLVGMLYDHYFRAETEFEGDLPSGPFLAVANHNAMTGMPDMFCHMVAFWRRYGAPRPAYGLRPDIPSTVPMAGAWLNACGAIAANPHNARRALEIGSAVLVFPGGDVDACKPYRRRYAIEFGGRRGFVRTAIREQVPIVPIVSVGAHQSLYILTDAKRIAKRLNLPKLARSNVAPLGLALPLALLVGVPFPHCPPPVKSHTRVGRAIELDLPPSAADDPAQVEEAFQYVVGIMQGSMQELQRAGRHGLFPRS